MYLDKINVNRKTERDEILEGLLVPHAVGLKSLPSKMFYDEKGSLLFDKICTLDEYYLTRTETRIMRDNISEIARTIGSNAVLIEFGSGSSSKTRLLFKNLSDLVAYVPIDISSKHLMNSVNQLKKDFPDLQIIPITADYTKELIFPDDLLLYEKRIAYFPGSTFGNFELSETKEFLQKVSNLIGTKGGFLIGIDLQKDKTKLETAYNDKEGVTAKFNLNILNHINSVYCADFNTDNFCHSAIYNEKAGRIEMYLISKTDHSVIFDGTRIGLKKGERILTEYSYKYTISGFRDLVSDIFTVKKVWIDKNNLFSIHYLQPLK